MGGISRSVTMQQVARGIQTIQHLLGHRDVKTIMVYLQTVPSVTLKESKSPLDRL